MKPAVHAKSPPMRMKASEKQLVTSPVNTPRNSAANSPSARIGYTPKGPKDSDYWVKCFHKDTHKFYYWNKSTNETRWSLPSNAVIKSTHTSAVSANVADVSNNVAKINLNSDNKEQFKKHGRRAVVLPDGEAEKHMSYEKKNYPKSEVIHAFLQNILNDHFLFQSLSVEEKHEIVDSMFQIVVSPNHQIITQGDIGDYFYIIQEGLFDVFVDKKKVGVLKPGNSFGELALLYNCPRAATIQSQSAATVWALDRLTLRSMLHSNSVHNIEETQTALKSVPLLKVLSEDQIEAISEAVRFISYKAKDVILKKGEVGDCFYIIREGTVRCSGFAVEKDQQDFIELSDHDFFGERALLRDGVRESDVTAVTDVKMMALDRVTFYSIIGPLREILDLNITLAVVNQVQLFKCLDHGVKQKLFKAFSSVNYKKGDYIIKQGDTGSIFYVIRSGEAKVLVGDTEVSKLSSGDYFGEMALSEGGPRQASVVALTDCECFTLDRANFERLVGSTSGAKAILTRGISQRKADNLLKAQEEEEELAKNTLSSKVIARQIRHDSFDKAKENMTDYELKDFEILQTLGTGTFGRVKLVRHKVDNKTFALKIQSKAKIVELKLQANIVNEKAIMLSLDHPFIISLYQTFQDRDALYMLLELVQGGELFSLLQTHGPTFDSGHQKFYAACVISAMECMHDRDILYRDLKPENLLIDKDGYLCIVDFGFAKIVKHRTYTLCGTPEYFSPELIAGKGYGKGNDIWAIGILVYEIMFGYTPFGDADDAPTDIYRRVLKSRLTFPSYRSDGSPIDTVGCKLVNGLLNKNVLKRTGCTHDGYSEIINHAWFRGFDWVAMFEKNVKTPWIPPIAHELDASNFDEYDEEYRFKSYHSVNNTGWAKDF